MKIMMNPRGQHAVKNLCTTRAFSRGFSILTAVATETSSISCGGRGGGGESLSPVLFHNSNANGLSTFGSRVDKIFAAGPFRFPFAVPQRKLVEEKEFFLIELLAT